MRRRCWSGIRGRAGGGRVAARIPAELFDWLRDSDVWGIPPSAIALQAVHDKKGRGDAHDPAKGNAFGNHYFLMNRGPGALPLAAFGTQGRACRQGGLGRSPILASEESARLHHRASLEQGRTATRYAASDRSCTFSTVPRTEQHLSKLC